MAAASRPTQLGHGVRSFAITQLPLQQHYELRIGDSIMKLVTLVLIISNLTACSIHTGMQPRTPRQSITTTYGDHTDETKIPRLDSDPFPAEPKIETLNIDNNGNPRHPSTTNYLDGTPRHPSPQQIMAEGADVSIVNHEDPALQIENLHR
jgi:hypothetical protein